MTDLDFSKIAIYTLQVYFKRTLPQFLLWDLLEIFQTTISR